MGGDLTLGEKRVNSQEASSLNRKTGETSKAGSREKTNWGAVWGSTGKLESARHPTPNQKEHPQKPWKRKKVEMAKTEKSVTERKKRNFKVSKNRNLV